MSRASSVGSQSQSLRDSSFVRQLSVEDFALYGVQFLLFVTCVLFLSREGVW
ncbi:hypothetical protein PRUPE_6G034900 [Prunus persica]|uniref:Protein RFT1 homolog n=1 Tax=Prunus persica TaxID=3760 RepID=A0A251NLE6_PRUPE|nr:hypothetical protein PRUPE_6G034900 [Prunus persica]